MRHPAIETSFTMIGYRVVKAELECSINRQSLK